MPWSSPCWAIPESEDTALYTWPGHLSDPHSLSQGHTLPSYSLMPLVPGLHQGHNGCPLMISLGRTDNHRDHGCRLFSLGSLFPQY